MFNNPLQTVWLKLFAGAAAFGLIVVTGVVSTISYYASNPEDLADRLGKQTHSLLPQHDSNPITSKTRQEVPDVATHELDKASEEEHRVPSLSANIEELAPDRQAVDAQPGRKIITLRVDAGWVRENHSADAKVKFLLKKHDKVFVLSSTDSWYFVQLVDGKQGWIHKSLF